MVAEDENKVIGYISGEILNGNVIYLNCLVVNPKKKGKRVGTKLLTEFKRRIKKLEVCMIFLFVPKSNPNSIKFYQKNGFVKGKEYVFSEICLFQQKCMIIYTIHFGNYCTHNADWVWEGCS